MVIKLNLYPTVNMIMLIFGILMGLVAGPLSNKFKNTEITSRSLNYLISNCRSLLFFLRNNTGIILYALAAGLGMGLWNALDNLLNLKVYPRSKSCCIFLRCLQLSNTITQAIAPVFSRCRHKSFWLFWNFYCFIYFFLDWWYFNAID